MRCDLHSYTLGYSPLSELYEKELETIYLRIMKCRSVDKFAITNYQDIRSALLLAEKLPNRIIIGCEYRVLEGESLYLHCVALGITPAIHQELLQTRFQGMQSFSRVLKKHFCPFFLVRVGWDIPDYSQESLAALEGSLAFFPAIKTTAALHHRELEFAQKLSQYYNLAVIGGSDTTVCQLPVKAYTEVSGVNNEQDFFTAIWEKRTRVGVIRELVDEEQQLPSSWEKKVRNLLKQGFGKKNIWETLWPLLKKFPELNHHLKLREHEKKVGKLERFFVDYLKLQQTKRVFSSSGLAQEERSKVWEKEINKIHTCFGSL